MKVAVTGAAGFIGSNLVAALAERGHDVIALDRSAPSAELAELARWQHADVLDPESLGACLDGAEIVFHLVAMITLSHHDDLAYRVNTEGAQTVAEAAAAAGVRRLVHCSSVHTFDQAHPSGKIDENSPRSVDPAMPVYDRSKARGEQLVRQVAAARGMELVICNPTGVYGPTDSAPLSRLNGLVRQAARGRMPASVTGHFDLVDVRDVVEGLILAAEHGLNGENYLLTGHHTSVTGMLRAASRLAGRRGPLLEVPAALVHRLIPVLEPIGRRWKIEALTPGALAAIMYAPRVDGSKAARELGYQPRPLQRTIEDLISHLRLSGEL